MKKLILLSSFWIASAIACMSQMDMGSNGKISVGKIHTLDNGWLKLGNDGAAQGLSFYDTQTGGTDARIYRLGNVSYFTRGGDHSKGIRIDSNGQVALGTNDVCSYTYFEGRMGIAAQNEIAYAARTYHTFDFGDAIRSQVFRANSITYAGWYNGVKTFHVRGNGDAYTGSVLLTSDLSLKSEIETISDPLSKVLQLRGVTFKMNFPGEAPKDEAFNFESSLAMIQKENPKMTRELYQQILDEQKRKRIGVIAQEVEKVIPEAVRTRDDGLKAVAYPEMVGLLIEAIKAQQNLIEDLRSEVEILKGTDKLRAATQEETVTGETAPEATTACRLYQNTPNPFTGETEIRYFVPADVQNASICIFDLQGKMLKRFDALKGENILKIRGSELRSGMYLYSLIVNGKEVDTKKMILTK
ncbi:MAG: tail fiber domain-containing protein [Dysgonamonadaceae bacterium]|jgi:hypothetical protein|nr:tail fiber domain-containing protein [Dysgonamonadaceae bacterium]